MGFIDRIKERAKMDKKTIKDISLEDITKIIEGTNRSKAPWLAPANGLYLYNIEY